MTTAHFDFVLESTRKTRENMHGIIADYSLAQLNEIPVGWNNNLIWNFGHVVVTQQLLCFGLAGLPLQIDAALVAAYRKGSKPTGAVTQEEVDSFLAASDQLLLDFVKDYQAERFQNYKPYTTSYGVTLTSVEEAFQFNLSHEALHLGSMLAIRKFL